jgi:DnaJ-class molecular chaperone
LPKVNSDSFGDLYSTINIRLPDSLNERERDLYKELRDLRSGAALTQENDDAEAVVDAGKEEGDA